MSNQTRPARSDFPLSLLSAKGQRVYSGMCEEIDTLRRHLDSSIAECNHMAGLYLDLQRSYGRLLECLTKMQAATGGVDADLVRRCMSYARENRIVLTTAGYIKAHERDALAAADYGTEAPNAQ